MKIAAATTIMNREAELVHVDFYINEEVHCLARNIMRYLQFFLIEI